jgi:hypothetical protein
MRREAAAAVVVVMSEALTLVQIMLARALNYTGSGRAPLTGLHLRSEGGEYNLCFQSAHQPVSMLLIFKAGIRIFSV